jgi:hypothetical protein
MSAELNLRVSLELWGRIEDVCAAHGLEVADFCRRAARQFYSGKIIPVVHHELLNCTTYKGKLIQSRIWKFDIKGKELRAVLVSALIKLEGIKAIKPPKLKEIEGIDYNVPGALLMGNVKDYYLTESF